MKLIKIIKKNYKIEKIIILDQINNKFIHVYGDNFFICCGSIQSPFLLKKNNIIKSRISSYFHLNIRVLSRFYNQIKIEKNSFATSEIDEFQKEGTIFIPSALEKKFISSSIVNYDDNLIKKITNNIEYCGFIVAQIKISSKINIYTLPFLQQPILTNWLNDNDKKQIKKSITDLIKLLKFSNAKEIYFPSKIINLSDKFDEKNLNHIMKKINYITVHTMSSIPLFTNNIIDNNARHLDFKNLYICDSSILPENIGQSPQGTIMAFAYEISNRFLNGN